MRPHSARTVYSHGALRLALSLDPILRSFSHWILWALVGNFWVKGILYGTENSTLKINLGEIQSSNV